MVITTVLTFFVIRYVWKLPLPLCIAGTAVFFTVDALFFASNLLKIADGGWFPLLLAALLYFLLATGKDGRRLLNRRLRDDALDLPSFLDAVLLVPPLRVDGTAVFLTVHQGTVPTALLHNLKHNKTLHMNNLFLTVQNQDVPRVPLPEQTQATSLGNGCWSVLVRFGFMDRPDVPLALAQASELQPIVDPMATSYFLSREIVVPTLGRGMAVWRQKLFAQMHHSASSAADFLMLPNNAVVELGSMVEM